MYPFPGGNGSQLSYSRAVQMIIMIVRNQHCVERRKIFQRQGRRVETFWPGKGNKRGAIAPYRIGQNAISVDLDQKCRVPYPRNTQAVSRGTRIDRGVSGEGTEWRFRISHLFLDQKTTDHATRAARPHHDGGNRVEKSIPQLFRRIKEVHVRVRGNDQVGHDSAIWRTSFRCSKQMHDAGQCHVLPMETLLPLDPRI